MRPGPEEDEAAQPAASAQKLRSQDQMESLVAIRYVLESDSDEKVSFYCNLSYCPCLSCIHGRSAYIRGRFHSDLQISFFLQFFTCTSSCGSTPTSG